MNNFQSMENEFDDNTKIYVFLHTYNEAYVDVDIKKLNGQDLFLIKKTSSLLLEDTAKLRILSTTVLSNNKNNIKLEGSKCLALLDNNYASDLVVDFNDKLTIKQDDEYTEKKPKITLQAQSENPIIVVDESLQFEYQDFFIDTTKEESKVTLYYGDRELTEKPDWETSEKVEVEPPKAGQPPKEEGGGEGGDGGSNGLPKGAIIGIVVGVVVVVIIVVVVLVYIFVIRKKRQNTDNEDDENDIDNSNI